MEDVVINFEAQDIESAGLDPDLAFSVNFKDIDKVQIRSPTKFKKKKKKKIIEYDKNPRLTDKEDSTEIVTKRNNLQTVVKKSRHNVSRL